MKISSEGGTGEVVMRFQVEVAEFDWDALPEIASQISITDLRCKRELGRYTFTIRGQKHDQKEA